MFFSIIHIGTLFGLVVMAGTIALNSCLTENKNTDYLQITYTTDLRTCYGFPSILIVVFSFICFWVLLLIAEKYYIRKIIKKDPIETEAKSYFKQLSHL